MLMLATLQNRSLGRTGESIAAVGMGTWGMGGGKSFDPSLDEESIEALRLGLRSGMNLVDTAETYGGGHSEEVVGRAIQGYRDRAFVATKISPTHCAYDDVFRSAKDRK